MTGGYYVDFTVKRDAIARYGLTVQDVEMVIESAIGGANITTTIEGRERFPVNVRYQRAYRSDINALRRTLIATPGGAQIPIEQVADITLSTGPDRDPHRAGAVARVRLCGRRRSRHRRLRRRGRSAWSARW